MNSGGYSPASLNIGKAKPFCFKVKLDIIGGLNDSTEPWCIKHDHGSNFNEWRLNITLKVYFRIWHFSRRLYIKESSRALKETIIKRLKHLHFKY